jgi:hypothetical protein
MGSHLCCVKSTTNERELIRQLQRRNLEISTLLQIITTSNGELMEDNKELRRQTSTIRK